MNKAVQEVEEQKPGVCHYEAAHAVFAYHSGHPIAYVKVGEEECECVSKVKYVQGDLVGTVKVVSGILAGKYAEELAATGKPREHVPFEQLSEGFKECSRTKECPGYLEMDELEVLVRLKTLGRVYAEHVYRTACLFAAKKVESRWDEICSVAAQLREVGYLDGDECTRIIESVAQAKEE